MTPETKTCLECGDPCYEHAPGLWVHDTFTTRTIYSHAAKVHEVHRADIFVIRVDCASDCGRTVALNVGADDRIAARRIAQARLFLEGWTLDDDDRPRCRACTLLAAGWSAAPGPAHPASAMSGEQ